MTSHRAAGPQDAETLLRIEREASVAALAHVYPPEQHPYPDAGVLERWRTTLEDPEVTVLLLSEEPDGEPRALVAFDAEVVRHLAVSPSSQGTGLGRRALDLAVEQRGVGRLWCLRENHRAHAFYRHLGWTPTGRVQSAEWPPYPEEVELQRG